MTNVAQLPNCIDRSTNGQFTLRTRHIVSLYGATTGHVFVGSTRLDSWPVSLAPAANVTLAQYAPAAPVLFRGWPAIQEAAVISRRERWSLAQFALMRPITAFQGRPSYVFLPCLSGLSLRTQPHDRCQVAAVHRAKRRFSKISRMPPHREVVRDTAPFLRPVAPSSLEANIIIHQRSSTTSSPIPQCKRDPTHCSEISLLRDSIA
jgi:hypothetical protein